MMERKYKIQALTCLEFDYKVVFASRCSLGHCPHMVGGKKGQKGCELSLPI
jgi:hypothetical protein